MDIGISDKKVDITEDVTAYYLWAATGGLVMASTSSESSHLGGTVRSGKRGPVFSWGISIMDLPKSPSLQWAV